MSVPKSKQAKSDFQVINKARELIKYTKDRCSDTRIFPKSQRWMLANDIWKRCSAAYSHLILANNIRVEQDAIGAREFAQERLLHQTEAIGNMDAMLALIDIANAVGYISEDRLAHWSKIASDVLVLAKSWNKNEKQKYNKWFNT